MSVESSRKNPEQNEFNLEVCEGRLLSRLEGPRRAVMAAMLAVTTGACTTTQTSVSFETVSGSPISTDAEGYCNVVDRTLANADEATATRVYQGTNGTVVVEGIKDANGNAVTVSITTPDGEKQRIDCRQ